MKVDYNGQTRYTLPGALRYADGPPELGTILGQNALDEFVTVVAHQDGRALVSVTTQPDIDAARAHPDVPRSVAEKTMLVMFAGSRL
jgi:hypothetical protein